MNIKLILFILFCCFTFEGSCLERKPINLVNADQLTIDTQAFSSIDGFHLVWWIPIEFWEVAFSIDHNMTEQQKKNTLALLRPYSMLAISQAEISPSGAFKYFDRNRIVSSLTIQYADASGQWSKLQPLASIPKEVYALQKKFTPVLAAAMGGMGQSIQFITLADLKNNKRILSPYQNGILQIDLQSSTREPIVLTFETPLNSLFTPRICPNGKEAHISWNFCPWDGSRLSQKSK